MWLIGILFLSAMTWGLCHRDPHEDPLDEPEF